VKLIKEIKSTLTRINPYGETLDTYVLSEAIYNEAGHRTSYIVFSEDGKIESKSLFELDDNGNVLAQIHYERRNDLIERTEFFDSEENLQYKTEVTAKDGTKTFHEYKYDQIGNTDQITIRNEEGGVEAHEIFKFDDQGVLLEEIRANEDYSVQFRKKISYNGAHVSKEEFFDQANRLQREIVHETDEKGLLHSKLERNFEFGTMTENKYTYDEAGNQILDETFHNGQLDFKNESRYDEYSNLVEERIVRLGVENCIEIIQHSIAYR
jgi:hypothetical protein